MKLFKTFCAAAAVLASASSFATVITVGSLSRVAGSQVIEDSLNNREWLGFDVTRGLNYAQTLAATQAGGIFAGYTIANNFDAQFFTTAMLGTHACTTSNSTVCVENENQNREQLVGESYYDYRALGYNTLDYDYAFFMNAGGSDTQVGLFEVFTNDNGPDHVAKINAWSNIASADYYSSGSYSIGWLLYRESGDVPEPSSLALVGVALLGAQIARRRRRS